MMKIRKEIGLVPIVVYIALIGLIYYIDPFGVLIFNPPYWPTILNVVFVTGTGMVVAALSASGYLKSGSINILLLGSAVLAGGFASLIGGYSANFVSGNYGVTTHNVDMLLSSALQVLSAVVTFMVISSSEASKRGRYLAFAYSSVILFVVLSTAIIYANELPIFLTATGPTLIRQTILGLTIVFFSLSCLLFYWQYLKYRSSVLYWYSLGLALFAIGMFCLLFQVKNGDMSSWVGRLAQYTGGFYFLIAVYSLRTGAPEGPDLSERWAETFGADRRHFATFFASMLNAFVYGRIVLDKAGKPMDIVVLDVNDAFERITGIKRERTVGRTMMSLFPGVQTDPGGWISTYGKVVQTNEPVQFESYFEPLNKWFNVSAYSPKKGYFVAIFEDVTERKRAEESLKRTAAELRDSNAELQQFAYVASHDLQEPLRMVVSYLSLLEKKYKDQLDPKAQEYIYYAVNGGKRMRALIDDLLAYSRVDTKGNEFAEVRMNEVVEQAINNLKIPIDESAAVVGVELLPTVTADEPQLVQLMQNLIGNAIKFRGEERPRVHVSGASGSREWTFSVRDNGIGIAPEHHEQIFQMFNRLHSNEKHPGTGIGLAVAKKIIDRHGGRIWVESEEGKGATFFFTIPQADADHARFQVNEGPTCESRLTAR